MMLNDLLLGKEDVREYETHCKLIQAQEFPEDMDFFFMSSAPQKGEDTQESQKADAASSAGFLGGGQLPSSPLILTVSVLTDGSWPSPPK